MYAFEVARSKVRKKIHSPGLCGELHEGRDHEAAGARITEGHPGGDAAKLGGNLSSTPRGGCERAVLAEYPRHYLHQLLGCRKQRQQQHTGTAATTAPAVGEECGNLTSQALHMDMVLSMTATAVGEGCGFHSKARSYQSQVLHMDTSLSMTETAVGEARGCQEIEGSKDWSLSVTALEKDVGCQENTQPVLRIRRFQCCRCRAEACGEKGHNCRGHERQAKKIFGRALVVPTTHVPQTFSSQQYSSTLPGQAQPGFPEDPGSCPPRSFLAPRRHPRPHRCPPR